MNLVYVMIPLLETDSKQEMNQHISQCLNIPHSNFTVSQFCGDSNKYAVQIQQSNFHFCDLNKRLSEFDSLQQKISLLEDVLKGFEYEPCTSTANGDIDELLRKVKKYKECKEENKKLKKLLQIQLDNTQKVREQTQKTMKVLRQQFDGLVSEIAKRNSNGQNPSISKSQKGEKPQYSEQEIFSNVKHSPSTKTVDLIR